MQPPQPPPNHPHMEQKSDIWAVTGEGIAKRTHRPVAMWTLGLWVRLGVFRLVGPAGHATEKD